MVKLRRNTVKALVKRFLYYVSRQLWLDKRNRT